MIIMIFEPHTPLYIPIFWVLLQSKKETIYHHALSHCVTATPKFKMEASIVTTDFEKGLINKVKEIVCTSTNDPYEVIPGLSTTNGCKFHFIKANTEKMYEIGIPKAEFYPLVGEDGPFQILLVIDPKELESYGSN